MPKNGDYLEKLRENVIVGFTWTINGAKNIKT
jgi:hypothetical protein